MSRTVRLTAACVADLDTVEALPPKLWKKLRRTDDPIRLAVAAGRGALLRLEEVENTGLFVGMGHGPLETGFQFLDGVRADGEEQASPTLFSHSVHNMAAGYLSACLGLLGPALTLQSYGRPFLLALQEGWEAVRWGRVDRALAVTPESDSPYLQRARESLTGGADAWPAQAVAWVLEAGGEGPVIDSIAVEETACDPFYLLNREGKAPLEEMIELTRSIERGGAGVWRIDDAMGRAVIIWREDS